jgi:hypothetical protein
MKTIFSVIWLSLFSLLCPLQAQIITTVAGNGTRGYTGNGGPATAAEMFLPAYLTLDSLGNVYIADGGEPSIRKVDTTGIISTVVGTGVPGFSGDGSAATLARLRGPYGVTTDRVGNIYILQICKIIVCAK